MNARSQNGHNDGGRSDTEWTPRPELLAAYADGEFEGCDHLAPLLRKIENWLARHSDAMAELAHYRKLRRLWQATTPREPSDETWLTLQASLDACCGSPGVRKRRQGRRAWIAAAACLAACLALVGIVGSSLRGRPVQSTELAPRPSPEVEPFLVATESEVVILRVEGEDAPSVVVGQFPVQGPLEMAAPGDVTLTSLEPHGADHMVPRLHTRGPGAPMLLWALTESERESP